MKRYSKGDFLAALTNCKPLTDAENRLLDMAYGNETGITAPQVAEALGYRHFVAANSLVGRLGKKLAEQLSNISISDRAFQGWHILFEGQKSPTRGFVWHLRPELRLALENVEFPELSHVSTATDETKNEQTLPEEVTELYEGAKKQIFINAYERNRNARQACIEHYGFICKSCEFNFEKTYGIIGKNYIQVHHIKPISAI
ncbi:restriction endonuclease-like [Hymenobacter roseosalivarius DSM 11622]|uniref:Restriction endonuclease-like n=1 Tax=Hymenobacter roseosalivarius DSM 11622 TaxID=645990 RepID=A0A1W1VXD4_9BACT|nr:hypothetical protein [Hymenobacter roseosalivarius]SMB98042.1 restriction endonuclease-like [Hymenobacter roseosalivarius DSM 11622]